MFVLETKEPSTLKAHEEKCKWFTPEKVSLMCEQLVCYYFLLKDNDLNSWLSDPEEFGRWHSCVKMLIVIDN